MEKEFVPFELAVKLKELGFDQKCFGWYNELKDLIIISDVTLHYLQKQQTLAPLWQQAFDWFRDQHNLSITIPFNGSHSYYWWIAETIFDGLDLNSTDEEPFETYEQARLACLEKLIELVTNK